jgi:hypothetical protein
VRCDGWEKSLLRFITFISVTEEDEDIPSGEVECSNIELLPSGTAKIVKDRK